MIKLKGTTIIEIVIATAMISIAVIAALSLTNKSQSQNTGSRNTTQANMYAIQVIDWARAQRDALGWASLNTLVAGTYCLDTLPASYLSLVAGACGPSTYIPSTVFTRSVDISKPSTDRIKFVINVTWQESSARSIQMETEIVQW